MRLSSTLIAFYLFIQLALGEVRWVSPTALGTADGTSAENASADALDALLRPGENLTVNFLPGVYERVANFGNLGTVTLNQTVKLVSTERNGAILGPSSAYSFTTTSGVEAEFRNFRLEGGTTSTIIVVVAGSSVRLNGVTVRSRLASTGELIIRDSYLNGGQVLVRAGTADFRNSRFETILSTPAGNHHIGVGELSAASLHLYDNFFFPAGATNIYAMRVASGSIVHVGGNSFFSIWPYNCATGSVNVTRKNEFCGDFDLNTINNCGIWNEQALLTFYDGCGVCGSRSNSPKDCEGTCWGMATTCPTPREIFVSVDGGGNGTRQFPATFSSSLLTSAGYKDTLLFYPGTYSNLNFLLPGAKALTLSSLPRFPGDPTTVTFQNAQITTDTTSFDTIIRGITFSGGFNAVVSPTQGLKFENCIFQNIVSGGMQIGFVWIEDSYFLNNTISSPAFIQKVTESNSLVSLKVDNFVSTNNRITFFSLDFVPGHVDIQEWAALGNVGSTGAVAEMSLIPEVSFFLSVDGFHSTNSTAGSGSTFKSIQCANRTLSNVNFQNSSFCEPQNALSCFGFTAEAGILDACSVCGGQDQFEDCGGVCFGLQKIDVSEEGCCLPSLQDCTGTCEGTAEFDRSDVCCVGFLDCLRDCNGTAVLDSNPEGAECCYPDDIDCLGFCFGGRVEDGFGGCCLLENQDCGGSCNNTFTEDDSEDSVCCFVEFLDCHRLCNGTSEEDDNGICCEGSEIDLCGSCGTCVTQTTSPTATIDTSVTDDTLEDSDTRPEETSPSSDVTFSDTRTSVSANTEGSVPNRVSEDNLTLPISLGIGGFVVLALILICAVVVAILKSGGKRKPARKSKAPPVEKNEAFELQTKNAVDDWSDVSDDSDPSSSSSSD